MNKGEYDDPCLNEHTASDLLKGLDGSAHLTSFMHHSTGVIGHGDSGDFDAEDYMINMSDGGEVHDCFEFPNPCDVHLMEKRCLFLL